MTDTLDDLFREARAAMRQKVAKRRVREHVPTEKELSAEERLRKELGPLENWQRKRAIALVHRETRTLIGTFVEYLHPKVPGARRLVREYEELPAEATEEVVGDWCHQPEQPPRRRHIWHETRLVVMDCVLGKMHVAFTSASLRACFGEGSLDRVELMHDMTFSSPRQPEFIILPAGTNILPEMSQSSIDHLLSKIYD